MSHYSLLYVGSNLASEMEPYAEDLEVKRIKKFEEHLMDFRSEMKYVSELYSLYIKDKENYIKSSQNKNKEHIDFLENEMPKLILWLENPAKFKREIFERQSKYSEPDDILDNFSTIEHYNPNSKWDWYVIGGRWANIITNINGDKVNSELVKNIDWKHPDMKDFSTFSILSKEYGWIEEGEMGWFGISSNNDSDWVNTFQDFILSLNPDEQITIVDCHI